MSKLLVRGGNKLKGEVSISGSKNAAVGVLPAALLVEGTCVLDNIPHIRDVVVLENILKHLGVDMKFIDNNIVEIDSSGLNTYIVEHELVKEMRASYYLMGALLGRFKKAEIPFPGGCNFAPRPIDQHIKGFEALGAKVVIEQGIVKMHADRLIGTQVYLDTVSVGATINLMLAATLAEGTTILKNAAKEPHVVDVANFLNAMGADIYHAGTDEIKIYGVKELKGGRPYAIIPDQIEAGTYMIAAAATRGDVTVSNIIPKHMEAVSDKLKEIGVGVEEFADSIRIFDKGPLKPVNIKTSPYPGFPTDMHPQMAVLLGSIEGGSTISEGVWDLRFQYAYELKKMGANINSQSAIAMINGKWRLSGAPVLATDLRAGIAMVIAGLVAEGTTEISDIKYIERGYEKIISKFNELGAEIEKVDV